MGYIRVKNPLTLTFYILTSWDILVNLPEFFVCCIRVPRGESVAKRNVWIDPGAFRQAFPRRLSQVGNWRFHFFWSNYCDLTRPHPKWWLSKGNPLISGKPRLVKYYNLARFFVEGMEVGWRTRGSILRDFHVLDMFQSLLKELSVLFPFCSMNFVHEPWTTNKKIKLKIYSDFCFVKFLCILIFCSCLILLSFSMLKDSPDENPQVVVQNKPHSLQKDTKRYSTQASNQLGKKGVDTWSLGRSAVVF